MYIAFATPFVSPLCQKPPSPITATVRLPKSGATALDDASPMPYPRTEFPTLNGACVENVEHPMSAETCVSPIAGSRWRRIFNALNTGRSGHPVQKDGGRFATGSGSTERTFSRWAVSAW